MIHAYLANHFAPFLMSLFDWLIAYFFIINTTFLILLVIALLDIRRQMQARLLLEGGDSTLGLLSPPITVIAPAYNEELNIAESIKSFLMLQYPNFEVIVVNDGSKDRTLEVLKEAYLLEPEIIPFDSTLSQTIILGTYRSRIHPNLVVIDKENGGKADALNVGIGMSSHEIFCAVDSDSILEVDALSRIILPFVEDPEATIAAGGTIRVANGSRIKHGRVISTALPTNMLALMQIIEYTRSFLCGRVGWNKLNATLVISGAFGLFAKRSVIRAGGYLEGSLGEDMELIVRMHRTSREAGEKYRVVFVPDPVCWTEVPTTIDVLARQRNRWQRGLADSLLAHSGKMLSIRYGAIGLIAFPYFIIVELLGPVIEVVAWVALLIAWSLGRLNVETTVLMFLVGVVYGMILSVMAIVIEEVYFSKYPKLQQFLFLVAFSIFEGFGYRQINTYWRVKALWDYGRGKRDWGKMVRRGLST